MPLVNVVVNTRAYTIACDDGEEEHLRELAAHVDSKVKELLTSVGQVGDQRLLLMAAVLITDELFEARARQDAHARKAGDLASAHEEISSKLSQSATIATESLEAAAERLEALTAKLSAA